MLPATPSVRIPPLVHRVSTLLEGRLPCAEAKHIAATAQHWGACPNFLPVVSEHLQRIVEYDGLHCSYSAARAAQMQQKRMRKTRLGDQIRQAEWLLEGLAGHFNSATLAVDSWLSKWAVQGAVPEGSTESFKSVLASEVGPLKVKIVSAAAACRSAIHPLQKQLSCIHIRAKSYDDARVIMRHTTELSWQQAMATIEAGTGDAAGPLPASFLQTVSERLRAFGRWVS